MQKIITDDLEALMEILPPVIREQIGKRSDYRELIEIIMDLGRPPQARFLDHDVRLVPAEVTEQDIEYVIARIGDFGDDNRAGIQRTLHRISAIRNRKG